MKKVKEATIALVSIVIAVISSIIIAQAGSVSDFYVYKSCVDDSECGNDGYCDDGKCIKAKEKRIVLMIRIAMRAVIVSMVNVKKLNDGDNQRTKDDHNCFEV